jgi:hypothetical protein
MGEAVMGLIDRAFAVLLLLIALVQALSSLNAYGAEALLWALSASAFMALLAAVNWLRAARPADRALATIAFGFGLLQALFVVTYAFTIHRFFDGRVISSLIVTLALVWFSARSLARR